MRKTTLALVTTALLALPLSATAKSRGFDTTISQPVQSAVTVEVALSDDLAHRANNLPKKLRDRNGARGRSGFSGNGFYGDDALAELVEEVHEQVAEDFEDAGITLSLDAPVTLRVVIEDARNNRPTHEQLSREPGLSLQSVGTGGAELSAVLIAADGMELGTMDYRWFDSSMDNFVFLQANTVWTDARQAISRFSRHATKTLSGS